MGTLAAHFAHNSNAECLGAFESALHIAAKEIIFNHKALMIPPVKIKFRSGREDIVLIAERYIKFDSILVEAQVDEFRIDLLANVGEHKLAIEICVTHKVDDRKRRHLQNNGFSVLEIDLSSCTYDLAPEILEKIVLNDVSNKSWLVNQKEVKAHEFLMRSAKTIKSKVFRGKGKLIECPLGFTGSNAIKGFVRFTDCAGCNYALGISGINPEVNCIAGNKSLLAKIEKQHLKNSVR